MNINFRPQPEPQLNYRGTTRQRPSDPTNGKRTYFVCRHSPHPKTVCHIKGLNDIPVCVVRDQAYNEGNFFITGSKHSQPHRNVGTAAESFVPNNVFPSLMPAANRANLSHLTKDTLPEIAKRSGNTPLLKKKDDPLRKYLEGRPKSGISQDFHLFPLQAMRHKPDFKENIIYSPSYLDQEIKVLEKLCDILQTDTLAEIQKWLSKASVKEKEFVTNFIRSDMTTRDLLNYKQNMKLNENEAQNIQALLKCQKGPPSEDNQFRTASQPSLASKESRTETERSNLRVRKDKIKIPTSENVPSMNFPSSPAKQSAQSNISPQDSTHLLYRKACSRKSRS